MPLTSVSMLWRLMGVWLEMSGQLHVPAALSPGNPSLVPIEWAPDPIWALQTQGKHRHIPENRTTIFRSSSPLSSQYVDFAIPAVVFFRSAYSIVNNIITAVSADNTVEKQRQRSKSAMKCYLSGAWMKLYGKSLFAITEHTGLPYQMTIRRN